MTRMSVGISFRTNGGRHWGDLELSSGTLEKLGRAWGDPRALYSYVALLVLPESYWWEENLAGFGDWRQLQAGWQDQEQQERMIEVIAQLA